MYIMIDYTEAWNNFKELIQQKRRYVIVMKNNSALYALTCNSSYHLFWVAKTSVKYDSVTTLNQK